MTAQAALCSLATIEPGRRVVRHCANCLHSEIFIVDAAKSKHLHCALCGVWKDAAVADLELVEESNLEPSPFDPSVYQGPWEQVLKDALRLISEERRKEYGPLEESFESVAAVWSAILKQPVTAQQAALCMIGLKLCREANRHKRDNLVDLVGYTLCLEQLTRGSRMQEPQE